MAPVSSSVTRNLASGDIVVSLADIVERLGGKLSQTDIDDLLRAIVSKRKSEVRPGDLITSDLMNQVLAELADLQVRVAKLEVGGQIPRLEITGFDPESNVHVNDLLTLKGSGFTVPGERNTVKVGNTTAQPLNLSSDRNNLAFVVPDPGISLLDPIVISVVNAEGDRASRSLRLLAAVNIPQGRIEVPYTTAPSLPTSGAGTPGTFAPGEWIFGFGLNTIVQGAGIYRVSLAGTTAGWTAALLAENQNTPRSSNVFAIAGNATQPLRIRLTVSAGPAVPTTGTLRIDVVETTANTKVTPGNQTVSLTIGQPIPLPDNRIRVSLLEAQNAVVRDGRVLVVRGDTDPAGVTFNALVTQQGRYRPTVAYTNAQGWTTTEVGDGFNVPTSPPVGQPANGSFSVFIKAGVDAGATDLMVTLTRTEGGAARFLVGIGLQ